MNWGDSFFAMCLLFENIVNFRGAKDKCAQNSCNMIATCRLLLFPV